MTRLPHGTTKTSVTRNVSITVDPVEDGPESASPVVGGSEGLTTSFRHPQEALEAGAVQVVDRTASAFASGLVRTFRSEQQELPEVASSRMETWCPSSPVSVALTFVPQQRSPLSMPLVAHRQRSGPATAASNNDRISSPRNMRRLSDRDSGAPGQRKSATTERRTNASLTSSFFVDRTSGVKRSSAWPGAP